MKETCFNNSFFLSNRQRLTALLPENSLAIISANNFMPKSADQTFPLYQNQDYYYLTGLKQEKSILCICKSHPDPAMRQVLFLLNASPEMEIWTGYRYTKDDVKRISGIETVLSLSDFPVLIKDFMTISAEVLMLKNEAPKFISDYPTANDLLITAIQQQYPLHRYGRLSPVMMQLRLIKQKEELGMIKKAISITEKALHKVMKQLKPGLMEYQVAAEITREILWNGGNGHAFEPIVAGGKNACVLHYTTPNAKLNKEDLMLIDFGAEYEYYASDCSRTIPVGGKFTARQKQCYQAVLRVFKKAQKLYVPGNTINKINAQVNQWMEKEMIELGLFTKEEVKNQNPENPLFKKYFMHGTAHFVGLDVHDVGLKHIPLEKGMVLTCEPGIYIQEESIGIRIENMILVDKTPVDLMKHFPVEIEEIEKNSDKV